MFMPGWAQLVDTGRVAGQAIEVLVSGQVVVGEMRHIRDYDVLGLLAPIDVELGNDEDFRRRDKHGCREDMRMVCLVLKNRKAQLEELQVRVEGCIRNQECPYLVILE